jgi:hypothetical protein
MLPNSLRAVARRLAGACLIVSFAVGCSASDTPNQDVPVTPPPAGTSAPAFEAGAPAPSTTSSASPPSPRDAGSDANADAGEQPRLRPGHSAYALTFTFFDKNPRDTTPCNLYTTSPAFKTFFTGKRGEMSLVASLFSRILSRGSTQKLSGNVEVRAFDYDVNQGMRSSGRCDGTYSVGENTRGTAYGNVDDTSAPFIDYEPDTAGFRGLALLCHETLHTLGLGHDPDGDGIMAPVIFPDDRTIDRFVLDGLRDKGFDLLPDLASRIESGEKLRIQDLVATYLGRRVAPNGDDFLP